MSILLKSSGSSWGAGLLVMELVRLSHGFVNLVMFHERFGVLPIRCSRSLLVKGKKMFNIKAKYAAIAAIVVTPLLYVSAFAQSVAADPFDTALATVTTSTTKYASALVGVAAIAVVFMIAIKYVKKLPRAS